jgi:3-hydroxybutyryl-CoA dehydrogenase
MTATRCSEPEAMIVDTGSSRSFPAPHELKDRDDVVVILGMKPADALAKLGNVSAKAAVLVELGTECLGVHTGEQGGEEGSNILGFNRFRLGEGAPSKLVELVRQPRSSQAAIDAAKALFEAAGLQVAICNDFPGRIIDRLVRPYYNAALRRLDEGLATAADMDLTLRLGLGYPEGPIALLEKTGLARHFEVTQALHDALGDPAFAPARRARVAKAREGS